MWEAGERASYGFARHGIWIMIFWYLHVAVLMIMMITMTNHLGLLIADQRIVNYNNDHVESCSI
jgi:hypothetical protein